MRGGKTIYGPSTLNGNWVEDRATGNSTQFSEAPGFKTTKGDAELEGVRRSLKHFGLGLDLESKYESPLSLISYQDPSKLEKPLSISQTAYNTDHHGIFQDQFGSKSPLKSAPMRRDQLRKYRSTWSMDRETRDRRFLTENMHCHNASVDSQYRTRGIRDLPNVPVPVRNLRAAILESHGTHAMHLMQRVFKAYDVDHSRTLSRAELLELLKDLNQRLVPDDFEVVWQHFDRDSSGAIDHEEFVRGMQGEFAGERLLLVLDTYANLLSSFNNSLTLRTLLNAFVLKPRGLRNTKHLDCVAKEFANQWVFLDTDSEITEDLFVDYFASLSPAVIDDGEFASIVQTSFKL